MITMIVAIVCVVLVFAMDFKSIATNKKHGLPTIPLWQSVAKDAVISAIILFFFFKLACYNGIPVLLLLMLAVVCVYHFITTKTVAGRQIYAMGGNAKAASLSGINTKKVFFWVYANMGLLCGLAGIVLSARNASATPRPATALKWTPSPPATSAARPLPAASAPSSARLLARSSWAS